MPHEQERRHETWAHHNYKFQEETLTLHVQLGTGSGDATSYARTGDEKNGDASFDAERGEFRAAEEEEEEEGAEEASEAAAF